MVGSIYNWIQFFLRFKPAIIETGFLADLSRGSNSLNSDTDPVSYSRQTYFYRAFQKQARITLDSKQSTTKSTKVKYWCHIKMPSFKVVSNNLGLKVFSHDT